MGSVTTETLEPHPYIPTMKTWKFAGISFKHMHQGDLLRMVREHPNAEIVGIYDEDRSRMDSTVEALGIPPERVFTDLQTCMEVSKPDVVMLCPSTGEHAEFVERLAPCGTHILVEKPFAGSLAEADRMIEAMRDSPGEMMINWPLRWYPPHVTSKRLIDEGMIGEVREVHYYDGNRGPVRHGADKVELEEVPLEAKQRTWWYQAAQGGGSLLDYLGYGVTLGTWFHGGAVPSEVTALGWGTEGLEVDEHSITIARYARGLSKFETRWGTFTDPWTHQPQPKCGFVIVGSRGTITSYDYESSVRVQTAAHPEGRDIPVDDLPFEGSNPIAYFIDRLEKGLAPDGPLGVEIARKGQQIVDTAFASAKEKRALPLIK